MEPMSQEHANPAERDARFRRTAAGARTLAARLEDDRSMMAWVLAQYRAAEDKDDRLMAQKLGIAEYQLPHIALCKRPRDELFRSDIDAIAGHIGMDPAPLAEVVRLVDSLEAFGQLQTGQRRLLAAARDRAAEDPAQYDAAPDDPAAPGEDGPPAKPPSGDDDADEEPR
jgi:hypothetical protein